MMTMNSDTFWDVMLYGLMVYQHFGGTILDRSIYWYNYYNLQSVQVCMDFGYSGPFATGHSYFINKHVIHTYYFIKMCQCKILSSAI